MALAKLSYASLTASSNAPSEASSASSAPTAVFDSSPPAHGSPLSTYSTIRSVDSVKEDGEGGVKLPASDTTPLPRRIASLDPPQSVKAALVIVKEARQRLTIQLYYGVPELTGQASGIPGDETIRLVKDSRLLELVKHAASRSLFATMRAVAVLVGNETQAMRTLQAWLTKLALHDNESAKIVCHHVQRTLSVLREVQCILQTAIDTRSCYYYSADAIRGGHPQAPQSFRTRHGARRLIDRWTRRCIAEPGGG